MTGGDPYFGHLRRRSRLGLAYRRWWLYPRISRHLAGRVLDVGCGIGDMLRFRPGTIGVDVNPLAVDWCRRHGLPASVMPRDRLPFEDESFDGVLLDNVLEHLFEPRPLLDEVRRVMVVGGALVAGVPGRRGYSSDPDHKVFYDEPALRRVMRDAGLRSQRVFHMPLSSRVLEKRLRQYCVYGVFRREP